MKIICNPSELMKLSIGSKNPTKVAALKEILSEYDFLSGAEIASVDADSGVSSQPKSTEETITGAINRARAAFVNCDYSFGIESGLMHIPQAKCGYMDFSACIIYDGKETCLGLSSAFEFPLELTRLIREEGLDANEASFRIGLTSHKKIGSLEGAVGILTKGRVTRKDYTKQAIRMAMIQIENSSLYKR
jgi:inosine/xanthosine triphosphatase